MTPRQPMKTPHKSPQRSQTLMRSSVKKPAKASTFTAQSTMDVSKPKPGHQSAQPVATQLRNPERVVRAQQVERSSLVKKFSDFGALPSGKAPAQISTERRVETLAVVPAPGAKHTHQTPALSKTASLLENGMRNAKSHDQTLSLLPSKRSRSRLASIGAGGLALLLLGAFVFYQNMPNLAMRYASQRAGIAAQLPDYQPSGFALSSRIGYTPGQIELYFNSNADDRAFSIVQRESTWNSDTLLQNYVSEASENVQTYIDKGRTIYLYGDSGATWVNAGVWYDIKGNSQLNSDQLIRIASSM